LKSWLFETPLEKDLKIKVAPTCGRLEFNGRLAQKTGVNPVAGVEVSGLVAEYFEVRPLLVFLASEGCLNTTTSGAGSLKIKKMLEDLSSALGHLNALPWVTLHEELEHRMKLSTIVDSISTTLAAVSELPPGVYNEDEKQVTKTFTLLNDLQYALQGSTLQCDPWSGVGVNREWGSSVEVKSLTLTP